MKVFKTLRAFLRYLSVCIAAGIKEVTTDQEIVAAVATIGEQVRAEDGLANAISFIDTIANAISFIDTMATSFSYPWPIKNAS